MTMILTNPRERTRFLRFAVVGVVGAIVDFGVANGLRVFGIRLVIAGTISFIAAILSNFLWNRYWTYPDSRSKPVFHQLMQFSMVSAAGLAIRIPVLALLEPKILSIVQGFPYSVPILSAQQLSDNITLAVAVIIVMFWNFFINRYWTYSDVE